MISITLSDGTILDNLTLNGDNFISINKIDESIFENNLSPTIINIDGIETVHSHMNLLQIKKYGYEWWFVIQDISEQELRDNRIQSQLDYIAMMVDIDLEDF